MARSILLNRTQWLPVGATLAAAAALTALLAYGLNRASQLQAASTAMQLASELAAQPQLMRSELALLQRGLESRDYVGDSLRSLAESRSTNGDRIKSLNDNIRVAGLVNDTGVATALKSANSSWERIATELGDVAAIKSSGLYTDTATGSVLAAAGVKLQGSVNNLLNARNTDARQLTSDLGKVTSALRQVVTRNGATLRTLLLGGTAMASVLVAMMLFFALRARASGTAARNAVNQVENILGTVREGLFLVDKSGRVGQTHSSSLIPLLHNQHPSGQTFDELLRPLVDEKTLTAAVKYLNLLWRDKVNEDLIESVNPLQQIEVKFAQSGGGTETRYLSFAFRRARESGQYVFGIIADVTDRVLLQRELTKLKSEADTGGSMLLQMISVDPAQLQRFLDGADRAFQKSNAALIAPGRDQTMLREKLNHVFRELHAVKGEAAALGLEGFARAIHAAEEVLTGLRDRTDLVGSDFVPVVTHLDELIGRAQTLRDARQKIAAYSQLSGAPGAMRPSNVSGIGSAPRSLGATLENLAREVGRAVRRNVQLQLTGLDNVPAQHQQRIKDITIQMVRNAIVHGIEPAEQRAAAGKSPTGHVMVSLEEQGGSDYLLQIEDDGAGLSYEQILNRALSMDLVKPTQAVTLDRAAVFRLLFAPGFSTITETTEHAGRGVGLDVVNTAVREAGGRIGISTTQGRFTRFKILLPKAVAAQIPAA
jgi:signal transduction histidine kinase